MRLLNIGGNKFFSAAFAHLLDLPVKGGHAVRHQGAAAARITRCWLESATISATSIRSAISI